MRLRKIQAQLPESCSESLTRFCSYDEIIQLVDEKGRITALLIEGSNGERSHIDDIIPLVQTELRRIAARYMRREAPNHILQPTALVNEAYLKLIDQKRTSWQNRMHFFAIAAQLMRQVLVDRARRGNRQKRGGLCPHVTLDHNVALPARAGTNVLALDEALSRLAKMDERKAKVVEMRCFAGLEVTEIAELLNVSAETVMRDWRLAKVWLRRELERPLPECSRTVGQK